MSGVDFTDDEREAMIALLTEAIQDSRFPLSPRIQRLKRIRAKLRAGEPPRARRPAKTPPR